MRLVLVSLLAVCSLTARADVVARDAWARATVPGQNVGGMFMTLQSTAGAVVTGAACSCAAVVQMHETIEKNGVASMVERPQLDLPAGKPVVLRPGGLHIMLFDLKAPLKVGQAVQLTLQIKEKGKTRSLVVPVAVRDVGAMAPGAGHDMHHDHHD